ncbi:MAG TPA: AtpZ/AtpI family protein [Acidimicrobiales bacterium]|nr:AtpZ/AtpI family protein [Acidimicrobiales bacterium]
MSRGFGDGLSRGFELTITPMLVGVIGFLLDRWLGLVPVLTIVFSLWGLGVSMYMTWFRYDQEMKVHEARRLEAGDRRSPGPARWARTDDTVGSSSDLRSAGA